MKQRTEEDQDQQCQIDDLEELVKERTAELEESREMYKILADASPVGLFKTDYDGQCTYVNDTWCEITGLTPDEAYGEGWIKAVHPDDRDRVYAAWIDAVKNRIEIRIEYRFKTPDDIVTWVIGQARPVNHKQGYVGTVTNITSRKELLPKLIELKAELGDGNEIQIEANSNTGLI